MRQPIHGLRNHPDYERMSLYYPAAPEGSWIGTLDYVAWGQSQNLLCYFTAEVGGEKYRLSTFANRAYRPHGDGPSFDQEQAGGRFEIMTETSRSGMPKFVTARKLDAVA